MSDISVNRISFNNRNYDISQNTNSSNTVSQRFANSLKNASQDNNISQQELEELKQISESGSQSEKEIVISLSKAGTALIDNNADDTIEPVQVTFGTPSARNTSQASPLTLSPTNTQNTVSIQDGRLKSDFNISSRLNNELFLLLEGNRGGRITTAQFENLKNIANSSGNPQDLIFLTDLQDKQASTNGSFKINLANGREYSVRLETNQPNIGPVRSNTNFTFGQFANSATTSLVEGGRDLLRGLPEIGNELIASRVINRPLPVQLTYFSPVTMPTSNNANGLKITSGSGTGNDGKFYLGAGLAYSAPLSRDFRLEAQGTFSQSLFTNPLVFGERRLALPDRNNGFTASATVTFQDRAFASIDTNGTFSAGFNIDDDTRFAYDQTGRFSLARDINDNAQILLQARKSSFGLGLVVRR